LLGLNAKPISDGVAAVTAGRVLSAVMAQQLTAAEPAGGGVDGAISPVVAQSPFIRPSPLQSSSSPTLQPNDVMISSAS